MDDKPPSISPAYLLKEELRALYHLEARTAASEHLRAWLAWASRSRLRPFVKLARTIRRYRDGILAATVTGSSPPSAWSSPTPALRD
jgi:transposase